MRSWAMQCLCVVSLVWTACDGEREGEEEDEGKTKAGYVDPAVVNAPACGPTTTAPMNGTGFAAQTRVGCTVGDQWEPAIAADRSGHVYILETQYAGVPACPTCPSPTIEVLTSDDRGATFSAPRPIVLPSTGQWDPQIVVDPADGTTVYAAWLQNLKSDIAIGKSTDFGATWSIVIANHTNAGTDKPILAVRGNDLYVAYNHAQKAWVSASHDGGATFTSTSLSTGRFGWSLPAGGTVDPQGNVAFGWDGYTQSGGAKGPVNLYVTRSSDKGKTWTATQLDTSAAPPDCAAYSCGWAYLGGQLVVASDVAGTLYALWNAGSVAGGPERMYFSSLPAGGTAWVPKSEVSLAPSGIEHGFPAIVAGAAGEVHVAWMDARANSGTTPVWNTWHRSSADGGETWSDEEAVSSFADGLAYVHPEGYDFPFGDYFEIDLDERGTAHVVWGEGANYDSPGSVWYSRGR